MIIQAQVLLSNAIHSMTGFKRPGFFCRTPNEKRGRITVRRFLSDQRGLNTVELVVIIAIVIGLALLFRGRITTFVTVLLDGLFSDATAKTLVDGVKVGK
jgi:Flp pilus assembly pilin Flp